jgi:Flp pilus assembly protein CpaB
MRPRTWVSSGISEISEDDVVSTDISGAVADRQRSRAGRRAAAPGPTGQIAPPRQRRPALAALALLLIVGGALVAGLLAVRMDSRVPVLVAKQAIEPGTQITEDDIGVVRVASDDIGLIGEEYADEVVGAYAVTRIEPDTLLTENNVSSETPIPDGPAIVSVPLDGKLAPASTVRSGDLVQVVRATSASGGSEKAEVLGTAYVLEVTEPRTDDLGGSTEVPTASLLVLDDAALEVIDAASADEAGLAILDSGLDPDVELEGPQ